MIEKLKDAWSLTRPSSDLAVRIDPCKDKINEVIDAVNALQGTVYAAPGDDICDDCAFDALLDELHELDTEQLQRVRSHASRILDQRQEHNQDALRDMDDLTNVTIDDADDDPDAEIAQRADVGLRVVVTKDDGLLFDFVRHAKTHPEERLFQALRNWSGYTFIFGSTATAHDDYSQLEDTFYKTTKGPRE